MQEAISETEKAKRGKGPAARSRRLPADREAARGRWEVFAAEFEANGRNGTQAAEAAGFSTPRSASKRLLKNPKVQALIKAQRAKQLGRVEAQHDLSLDKIVAELAEQAFANLDDFVRVEGDDFVLDLPKTTRAQRGVISEITTEVYTEGGGEDARQVKRTKVKFYDKQKALLELGKHFGFQKQANADASAAGIAAFFQSLMGSALPVGHQRTVGVAIRQGPAEPRDITPAGEP